MTVPIDGQREPLARGAWWSQAVDHPLMRLLCFALVLRLAYWMPHYLTNDILDYLNAADMLHCPQLGDIVHLARLGMIGPLGLSRWLFGNAPWALALYPLGCSLGTVALTYDLAARLGGKEAGWLAGLLMAIVPLEVVYGTIPLPDTALSFSALAGFWFLVRAEETAVRDPAPWAMLSGCLIGLAYTCKVTALFFALPAGLQAYFLRRRLREAICFAAGLGGVVLGEVVVLRFMLDRWYITVLETAGYMSGAKGQYHHLHITPQWWLEQIWFKLGALFWGRHLPTAALLIAVPHLLAVSLLRLWKSAQRGTVWWAVAWVGVFSTQQFAISSIAQEPRYWQAALPYMALIIALGWGTAWREWGPRARWAAALPVLLAALAGAAAFKAVLLPGVAANEMLLDHLQQIVRTDPDGVAGGSSEYVVRLAHYAGMKTVLCHCQAGAPGYWLKLTNGYPPREGGEESPLPAGMELWTHGAFAMPLQAAFEALGFVPAVGFSTAVEIYRRP